MPPTGNYGFTVRIKGEPNSWVGPDDGFPPFNDGFELYSLYAGNGGLNSKLIDPTYMLTCIKGMTGYPAYQLMADKIKRGKAKIPGDLKKWFNLARKLDTPLPDVSRVYDSKLGLYKI